MKESFRQIKKIFRNVSGLLAGIISFFIVSFIMHFIFALMLRIPFLVNLLSYPSSPDLYVYIGVFSVSALAGRFICSAISVPNKQGYKTGDILLGVFYIFLGAYNSIAYIFWLDFNLSVFISEIFLIGLGIFTITSSNE